MSVRARVSSCEPWDSPVRAEGHGFDPGRLLMCAVAGQTTEGHITRTAPEPPAAERMATRLRIPGHDPGELPVPAIVAGDVSPFPFLARGDADEAVASGRTRSLRVGACLLCCLLG